MTPSKRAANSRAAGAPKRPGGFSMPFFRAHARERPRPGLRPCVARSTRVRSSRREQSEYKRHPCRAHEEKRRGGSTTTGGLLTVCGAPTMERRPCSGTADAPPISAACPRPAAVPFMRDNGNATPPRFAVRADFLAPGRYQALPRTRMFTRSVRIAQTLHWLRNKAALAGR